MIRQGGDRVDELPSMRVQKLGLVILSSKAVQIIFSWEQLT